MEKVFYIYKYSIADEASVEVAEKTRLEFLPMIQRRKLSQLGKIAFATMFETLEGFEGELSRLIFASQFGEFDRLLKLIEQYQTENEVSPSVFSMSVHNATIGGFSLLNKINAPYNSLSAGENTLSAGLLDAIMNAGGGGVLFCYADSKSVSCLIGQEPRADAIKIIFEQGESRTEGEFEAFSKFLKGEKNEFGANFYTLKREK